MTGLTVPKAGIEPGRAANVRVEASQTGAAVAQFGQVMEGVGQRLTADRLSRERGRLQVDMVRDMNALRLEFEKIGDPDILEQQWPTRIKDLREQYMTGQGANGRPRVDPQNAADFGLAFDDLAERHGFSMGQRAIEGRFAQREATWINYQHEAVNSAMNADPGTIAILLENGDEQIDELVASNTIDAAEGAKRKLGLRQGMANGSAITMVADDPQGFLEAADDGEYSGLPGETLQRYRVQAQGNIDRRVAAEGRAADAAAKERTREVGVELADLAKISGDSRRSVNIAILDDPEFQAHPDYAKTMAAVDLMNERADLPMLTAVELTELIAQEKRRTVAKPYQTERLQVLEEQLDASEKGWAKDPISYALEIGLPVPELPDVADADPQELATALARRAAFGRDLTEAGYTRSTAYLSDTEQDALKAEIEVSTDPARRAELAATLTRSIGARDPGAVLAVSGDPVFAHVGGLLNDGGRFGVAQEIFRGQQVMAEKAIVMPPVKERLAPVFKQLGSVFADLSGGVTMQSNIVAATDALYASRQSNIDPAGDLDSDGYKQALHEVMGGTGQFGENSARGGVQEINGQLVALPSSVSGLDVNVTMQAIETLFRGGRVPTAQEIEGGWKPDANVQALATKILGEVSIGGKPPFIDGAPISAATFTDVHLQAVGSDRYRLIYRARGQTYFLTDEGDNQFEFSLTQLVRRVSQ